jgi:hypothetical protein
VRFRGTLRAVEVLGASETTASLVGYDWDDQRFVVKIAVESVEPNPVEPNPDVRKGAILKLAIHSPTESFGGDVAVGTSLNLEMISEYRDDVFWRFIVLRPRPTSPQQFEGALFVGGPIMAAVEWDGAKDTTVFSQELRLPMHYSYYEKACEWVNPGGVQQLRPDRPWGQLVLEVQSAETAVYGENRYLETYKCAFISLKRCNRPCPAAR